MWWLVTAHMQNTHNRHTHTHVKLGHIPQAIASTCHVFVHFVLTALFPASNSSRFVFFFRFVFDSPIRLSETSLVTSACNRSGAGAHFMCPFYDTMVVQTADFYSSSARNNRMNDGNKYYENGLAHIRWVHIYTCAYYTLRRITTPRYSWHFAM